MRTTLARILVVALQLGLIVQSAFAQDIQDRRYVCMMQDSLQVKPGVPIEYDGRTYYGCCPMCAKKMISEPARYMKSKDPVSQVVVDKASSFIYGFNGKAFYFESEETRQKFAADPKHYAVDTR